MKLKRESVTVFFPILLVFFLFRCNSIHHAPTNQELQASKLNGEWNIISVLKDNVQQAGFSRTQLTISGSTALKNPVYAVTGQPPKSPWPAGGSWDFGGDVMTQLIRDKGTSDELEISYSVTDKTLTLQFQFSGIGYPGGKINAVTGAWIFAFARQ